MPCFTSGGSSDLLTWLSAHGSKQLSISSNGGMSCELLTSKITPTAQRGCCLEWLMSCHDLLRLQVPCWQDQRALAHQTGHGCSPRLAQGSQTSQAQSMAHPKGLGAAHAELDSQSICRLGLVDQALPDHGKFAGNGQGQRCARKMSKDPAGAMADFAGMSSAC